MLGTQGAGKSSLLNALLYDSPAAAAVAAAAAAAVAAGTAAVAPGGGGGGGGAAGSGSGLMPPFVVGGGGGGGTGAGGDVAHTTSGLDLRVSGPYGASCLGRLGQHATAHLHHTHKCTLEVALITFLT